MSGVGAAVGLILGGWLTGPRPAFFGIDVEGWRLTFLINVPIGLVAAFLAPRLLNESESHPGELDLPGAVTGTLGLLGIVYGLTRAGTRRLGRHLTDRLPRRRVVLLVAFGSSSAGSSTPAAVPDLRQPHPRPSFVAMLLVPAAMFAMFYFLSLYIQNVMGYSPLQAGLAFLPFSFGIVVGGRARLQAGQRSTRATSPAPARSSPASRCSASRRLALTTPVPAGATARHRRRRQLLDHPAVHLLMAFGMGLTFVPLTLTAVHRVRAEDSGIGSGVLNTMQQVGGALGLATLATVATALHRPGRRVRPGRRGRHAAGRRAARGVAGRPAAASPRAPQRRSWSAPS